jgi:hypothetical protein
VVNEMHTKSYTGPRLIRKAIRAVKKFNKDFFYKLLISKTQYKHGIHFFHIFNDMFYKSK